MQLDGIALGLPVLLFLLRPVILPVNVAHVMSTIAIGIGLQERRSIASSRAVHQSCSNLIDRSHVLSIDGSGLNSECCGATKDRPRGSLGEMCVLVVEIVFADVDHGQLPKLREVHDFIKRALSECALSKETDGHSSVPKALRRERRTGGDADAAADDRVGSEVTGLWVRNVHGPALSPTVASFFAQQLGEHAIRRSAFRQTVSMATMCTGDVVVDAQRLANAHGDGLFSAVEMRQSGHKRTRIEFVHLLFKQANSHHLAVGAQPLVLLGERLSSFGFGHRRRHCFFPPAVTGVVTPAIVARTSKTQAKSYFVQPMPRAAVRNSLLTAVVGRGTSSCRPRSIASTMSFCIMFTSNHASSGCCRTNGPRYWIIGEATALWVSTSTATSRLMPLFSASSTPSEKASICTARLRLVAIFIERAKPLSPTCVTFGPMSSSRGLILSKVSFLPPTITDNFPSCRVITLPDTGESTMSAPRARTFSASARLTAGLTVLMSMNVFPVVNPARSPSGPSVTAWIAWEFVTMAKVKSDELATARGESAHCMPFSTSHCALARVRL